MRSTLQIVGFGLFLTLTTGVCADESSSKAKSPNATNGEVSDPSARTVDEKQKPKLPSALVPLNRQKSVLLDLKGKRVLLKSRVCLRDGQLEMLICKKQTKEHESILSVDSKAYVIHTALLALGVKTGTPVKFDPKYEPPKGQEIDIYFQWTDKTGKPHRTNAQNWVRTNTKRFYVQTLEKLPSDVTMPKESELRYDDKHKELLWYGIMTADQRDELAKLSADENFKKLIAEFHRISQPQQLNAKFVFTGGGLYVDEETGERSYLPEGGGVVCVANFASSMIDIAQRSSAQEAAGLLFEAHTERIPPLETEVLIELIPVTKSTEKSE